ncbi:MAG TPA: hypothetical protein DIU15_00870, partial [Deltaproteobacteria bacterium]|nr:hypothetical protein [Deltaproteobacteria bacterium]
SQSVGLYLLSDSAPAWSLRLRRLLRGSLFAGGTVIYFANYELFVGDYQGLHLGLARVSLAMVLLAMVGLQPGWVLRVSPSLRAKAVLSGVVVALAVASGVSGAVGKIRPDFIEQSMLGQTSVLFLSEGSGSGSLDGDDSARTRLRASEAWSLFRASSQMPKLPKRFKLKDYNILLVTIEALRYDQSSLGAPDLDLTPNLARLAGAPGSYNFQSANAPSTGTLQSMASLMTMSYPSAAPLIIWKKNWHGELDSRAQTVAESLGRNGYATFWASHNYRYAFTNSLLGLGQGFDSRLFTTAKSRSKSTDLKVRDDALQLLEKYGTEPKPFFGWVFLASPHFHYVKHYDDMPGKTRLERYRQEVRFADVQLGKLLDAAENSEWGKNTIIIVTGDHGEEFGEHGGKYHRQTVYSEVTHVPLVVQIPGAKGGVINQPTSVLYVFPWLLRRGPKAVRKLATARVSDTIAPVLQVSEGAVVVELL